MNDLHTWVQYLEYFTDDSIGGYLVNWSCVSMSLETVTVSGLHYFSWGPLTDQIVDGWVL